MKTDFSSLPLWESIAPISLEEMDGIRLMNRIDTKFVTSEEALTGILEDAAEAGYRVCTIDGHRIMGYSSIYYDTPGLDMYLAHHNGRKTRQKIRTRRYLVSGDTWLEVKRKNNKGRTKKKRVAIPAEDFTDFRGNPEACRFLEKQSWFRAEGLSAGCTTEFERITLVNAAKTERLTIDMRLHFRNCRNGAEASLKDAVIIELKQDGRVRSQMREILLRRRVMPYRISKYCIGTALTAEGIKTNRFKEKIRYIEKQINDRLI